MKRVTAVKSRRKKVLITHMMDQYGFEKTGRMDIANIFADFYSQLYADMGNKDEQTKNDIDKEPDLTPFTREELVREIKQLKNNRCKDSAGLVAEMLKNGGAKLVDVLLDLYNEILSGKAMAPSKWKQSVMTVIHKSGDVAKPQNYRRITIVPLLYKLFSRLLYVRLYPITDKHQCEDQAGFRKGFSTDDHTFTFSMISEKSQEFHINVWVAVLDFKKAFDTIKHDKLWEALLEQDVPRKYVDLLRGLYQDQRGRVKTDRLSKRFDIRRGTRQGGPLSSLLFSVLLEGIMRKVKARWTLARQGLQLGHEERSRLSNLRFADDILLVGKSLHQVTKMLEDVHEIAGESGLALHPDKTKILSSTTRRKGRDARKTVDVHGLPIEVLSFDSDIFRCKVPWKENHV